MEESLVNERKVFLSTEIGDRGVVRSAWLIVVVSALIFISVVPFARIPLVQVPAFIPMYVSCMVICDLITAVILFSQFTVLRAWSLLVLGSAYLFSGLITIGYLLIFPGLFSPTGLLGSGPQTSSAMYMAWHSAFPILIIAYSILKGTRRETSGLVGRFQGSTRIPVLCATGIVFVAVYGYVFAVTTGNAFIPQFIGGNHTTALGRSFLAGVWLLSLAALAVLWFRRPRSVLDVWLMVVMCVWLFDIALSALLNTGRYDLGWYVGRIYGVVACGFLLVLLLFENGMLYGRLFQLSNELSVANSALKDLALHDGLTGLANRRWFDKYLADQVATALRYNRTLALVLYDGEEFAMILPDTDVLGAEQIAEAARNAVNQLKIPHTGWSGASYASISGGVATIGGEKDPAPNNEMSAHQLVAAADRALYEAKHSGRNRIVTAQ